MKWLSSSVASLSTGKVKKKRKRLQNAARFTHKNLTSITCIPLFVGPVLLVRDFDDDEPFSLQDPIYSLLFSFLLVNWNLKGVFFFKYLFLSVTESLPFAIDPLDPITRRKVKWKSCCALWNDTSHSTKLPRTLVSPQCTVLLAVIY